MPPLPRHAHPSLSHSFSTSSATYNHKSRIGKLQDGIPSYPYSAKQWYKQSDFGLYAGRKIQFGNTVSVKHEVKNRRFWKPNVHYKRLWSEALQRWIRMNVTTSALRTIDKSGGLDRYLLGEKSARIKELGVSGWLLRWRIMQSPVVRKRFRKEREALGLPPDAATPIGSSGEPVTEAQLQEQIREFDERLDAEGGEAPEREADANRSGEADRGFMQENKPIGLN